ncbi:hypothetical protein [Parvibium lacunae]|nr:hypothetical protein [Parvibium lacunae]
MRHPSVAPCALEQLLGNQACLSLHHLLSELPDLLALELQNIHGQLLCRRAMPERLVGLLLDPIELLRRSKAQCQRKLAPYFLEETVFVLPGHGLYGGKATVNLISTARADSTTLIIEVVARASLPVPQLQNRLIAWAQALQHAAGNAPH